MSTAVTESLYRALSPEPRRKLWTREETKALEATGLFDQQRLELVEGELVNKMGKKRAHGNVARYALIWLQRVFQVQFVDQEMPVDVAPEDNPTSEPQPDLIVLARSAWEFKHANPQAGDLRLVVEVSDTTLGFDLKTKADLYARAGILEYWVFDIAARRLIVHREPVAGRYASVIAYSDQESVSPLAAPEAVFPVGGAFGDAPPEPRSN